MHVCLQCTSWCSHRHTLSQVTLYNCSFCTRHDDIHIGRQSIWIQEISVQFMMLRTGGILSSALESATHWFAFSIRAVKCSHGKRSVMLPLANKQTTVIAVNCPIISWSTNDSDFFVICQVVTSKLTVVSAVADLGRLWKVSHGKKSSHNLLDSGQSADYENETHSDDKRVWRKI